MSPLLVDTSKISFFFFLNFSAFIVVGVESLCFTVHFLFWW